MCEPPGRRRCGSLPLPGVSEADRPIARTRTSPVIFAVRCLTENAARRDNSDIHAAVCDGWERGGRGEEGGGEGREGGGGWREVRDCFRLQVWGGLWVNRESRQFRAFSLMALGRTDFLHQRGRRYLQANSFLASGTNGHASALQSLASAHPPETAHALSESAD